MPTVSDTLRKTVNTSLKGCRDVGDSLRDAAKSPTINSIASWIAAFSGLTVVAIFLNGSLTAENDVKQLREEVHNLSAMVMSLRDTQLRPDEVQRHLSAQDGRLDAIEGRLLRDEERIIRATTLLDQIDQANRQRMLPRP